MYAEITDRQIAMVSEWLETTAAFIVGANQPITLSRDGLEWTLAPATKEQALRLIGRGGITIGSLTRIVRTVLNSGEPNVKVYQEDL